MALAVEEGERFFSAQTPGEVGGGLSGEVSGARVGSEREQAADGGRVAVGNGEEQGGVAVVACGLDAGTQKIQPARSSSVAAVAAS